MDYRFIESVEEFDQFVILFRDQPSIIIPIYSEERTHPVHNRVCVLFIWLLDDDLFCVLPFDHNEAINLPTGCLERLQPHYGMSYTWSVKPLGHVVPSLTECFDAQGVEYLSTGNITDPRLFYSHAIKELLGTFRHIPTIWRAIPMTVLLEYAEQHARFIEKLKNIEFEPAFVFHQVYILPVCAHLEANGVHVDPEKFKEHYGQHTARLINAQNLVFTEYNPYTVARRVTNKFGGINFAAIDKKSRVREAYTSRFENGQLVLVDWESFHVRLIANLMKYSLPNEPVHQFLAKQYFHTNTITPEQYEEGKIITFRNLYGYGDSDIEFFKRVREYVRYLYDLTEASGYIETELGNQLRFNKIDDPSPGKVFNYLLQLRETEVAFSAMKKLPELMKLFQSKATLYTYDSLLFDVHPSEMSLLSDIKRIMEFDGQFPVRFYAGPNLGQLTNITNSVV
jgi:hypothetical protein